MERGIWKNRLIQQSSSSQSADAVEVAARHNMMTWRNNRTNCRNSIRSNPTTSETPKQMSIFASISKNKLELFDFSSVKKTDCAKEQIATLKKNCSLFSRLFIGCQTREGNLEEFFHMRTKVFCLHCHKMVHSDLATNLTCSSASKRFILRLVKYLPQMQSSLMELPLLIWCSQEDARPSRTMQKIVSYHTCKRK